MLFLCSHCTDLFHLCLVGLRGAIPYALSLHLGLEPIEKRQLIGTTTIIIVLFTILLLGGGTMPLIRIMDIEESQSRRKNKKDINLSKTEKMVMDDALFSSICTHSRAHTDSSLRHQTLTILFRGKNIKGLIVVCVTDTESMMREPVSSQRLTL